MLTPSSRAVLRLIKKLVLCWRLDGKIARSFSS